MILGKWVSNYNHMDKVVFIDVFCRFKEGIIHFPDGKHYSENYWIYSNDLKYTRKFVLVLANVQNDTFYLDNQHEVYKALFDNLQKRLEVAECNHTWQTNNRKTKCIKCNTRKFHDELYTTENELLS